MRSLRAALLASLALALLGGWLVAGHYLYRTPIGLDASGFPLGETIFAGLRTLQPGLQNGAVVGAVWMGLALLGVGLGAFWITRRARPASAPDAGRRGLLAAGVGLAAGALAGGVAVARTLGLHNLGRGGIGWHRVGGEIFAKVETTHPVWEEDWKDSRIRARRRFGRTGWEISDIVLGTSRIQGDAGTQIARLAFERGVNYFDTAPDYSAAGSEEAMGRALRAIRRDQVFIATKFCTPYGHLPVGTPVKRYKEAIEESLRRLGTDYVDLVHIHSCDELDRLRDERVHTAFDELRQEGKARFLGFSTHTPRLVEVANDAIDSGRFDVMMVAYHHGIWAPLADIISRARREQDMGVVAMKTLKGAKHHGLAGFRNEADSYAQAALKWVLHNPEVSAAIISFSKLQHVDEYLYASGRSLEARDLARLRSYDRQISGSHCQAHCGACLESCPEGLPIHDVLRHRMYFEDYGWEKEGMRLYAGLERQADVCAGCSGPCLGSCPVGIAIPERMRTAHRLLTLG